MTKKVRIENADTSTYKVVVQVWQKGTEGTPDVMVSERTLHNPCDITGDDVYLCFDRYIVVRETV